jgi:hypothetical protein
MKVANWSRPASAFRFDSLRLKTNSAPDALPEHCSPYLLNSRSYNDGEIQSRPQMDTVQSTPSAENPVLSLESSIGIYKIGSSIYYAGAQIDAGYSSLGCSLTPFRPNQSPNAYEYVWDATKNSKVLVTNGAATVSATGIIEPQDQVEAAITAGYYYGVYSQNISVYTFAGSLTNGGGSTRVNDTVRAIFPDPASPYYYSIVSNDQTHEYGINEQVIFSTSTNPWKLYDVFPSLKGTISIASITYYSGTTGRCVVVPFTVGSPENVGAGSTIQQESALAHIRRGSIIQFSSGESCFVLSVTNGPAGAIAFEISTANTHTTAETITGLNAFAICTNDGQTINTTPTVGATITKATTRIHLHSGIGTVNPTSGISSNPFIFNGSPFRENDYICFSLEFLSGLENLTEMKLLIDVSDGSFTQDFYYATFRPADIMAAVANSLTTLGAAQITAQRDVIDEESQAKGATVSSGQTSPGSNVWSDIAFPIHELTRVGADPTKSLLTMKNFQFLFNCTGDAEINIALDFSVFGGYAVDIGKGGNPRTYRIRPRSSITGAKGNPSPMPRYGVGPRRAQVTLNLPTTYSDSQMDTWDIFAMGGTLDAYVQIGSVPLLAGSFNDIYADDIVRNNPRLDFDLHQPFPSIGPPISGQTDVGGYILTATFPTGAANPAAAGTLDQLDMLLPGNLINIGQQYYTLWNRPTLISTSDDSQTYQFLLQENAGTATGATVNLYEPLLAAQANPYVWGPDANGVFFSVGDPLRPGVISRTNPNNPDAASDKNSDDLCPPTEPLQNGALIAGTSIVFSPNRAWRGFPKSNGGYNWTEIPVGRGLAAPLGICTDGERIFYWAKDGICVTSGGGSASITDDDLYNLFPTEGTFPVPITYGPYTIYPPDYSRADSFRLATANGFLFADYQDSTGTPRSLVFNIVKKGWSVDEYARPITVRSPVTLPTEISSGTIQQQLFAGTAMGTIDIELSTPSVGSESVAWVVAEREETYGDIRSSKLFGDASFDAILPSGATATPMIFGVAQTTTTFPITTSRPQPPLVLNLQGEIRARALGCVFTGTDRGATSILYSFQLSYIEQPADITNRFQDWDDAGTDAAKYYEGFLIEADSENNLKGLEIRNGDTLQIQPFNSDTGTNVIQHDGQQIKSYSFNPPFIAHLVRYEPDEVSWRFFNIRWITQPTPEIARQWKTQRTTHGFPGFQHVQRVLLSYNSPVPITLTIEVDGTTYDYSFPATSGFEKHIQMLQAIKGLYFSYYAHADESFAVADNGLEVYVKPWGTSAAYQNVPLLGTTMGDKALV